MVVGAVASHSDQVVGISNVFIPDGGPDAAWPVLLEALHRLFPTLPVVGSEHGDGPRAGRSTADLAARTDRASERSEPAVHDLRPHGERDREGGELPALSKIL